MKKSQNTDETMLKRREKLLPLYMQRKLAIALLVIMLSFVGLTAVLYSLIRSNNDSYNKIVLSQRQASYDSRNIPFRRGDIMDRNGTILATSQKIYNLILDPKVIYSQEDGRYVEATVKALSSQFGFDESELRTVIQEKKEKSYVKYADGLSYDQKSAFLQYQEDTNTQYRKNDSKERIRGVWFEDEYRRFYPYNSLACNILGFYGGDSQGAFGGVEQYYNDTLMGVNGREYGYLDEETRLQSVIREPIDGKSLVTTINTNIQSSVERHLNEWQNGDVGSEVAAAIVMDPKNGEVLAMASTRQYDLNNPRQIDKSKYTDSVLLELGKEDAVRNYKKAHPDEKEIDEDEVLQYYTEDEVISFGTQVAWNQIWRNVAVSDAYEPGSTAKTFTIAGALEENAINENTTYICDGSVHLDKWTIRCNNRDGHGPLNTTQALMKSCNVFLMDTAFQEGTENFVKYMNLFNFGKKTGIDLPGEVKGEVYPADKIGRTTLATNSFGQNFTVTMIQIASAYCSVLNGGSYYRPHVLKQVLNKEGTVVKEVIPELVRTTASKETCDFLKQALFETVEEGTGGLAQIQGYHVGGKTGTAEKLPRAAKNYLVSFCGFAPIEDPQLLVYVIVDTPHLEGEEQASASFATRIEQKIMNEALQFLNIAPQGETDPENSINKNFSSLPEGVGSEVMGNKTGDNEEAVSGEDEGTDNQDGSGENDGGNESGNGESNGANNQVLAVAESDEKIASYDDGYELPDELPETTGEADVSNSTDLDEDSDV